MTFPAAPNSRVGMVLSANRGLRCRRRPRGAGRAGMRDGSAAPLPSATREKTMETKRALRNGRTPAGPLSPHLLRPASYENRPRDKAGRCA